MYVPTWDFDVIQRNPCSNSPAIFPVSQAGRMGKTVYKRKIVGFLSYDFLGPPIKFFWKIGVCGVYRFVFKFVNNSVIRFVIPGVRKNVTQLFWQQIRFSTYLHYLFIYAHLSWVRAEFRKKKKYEIPVHRVVFVVLYPVQFIYYSY